MIVYGDSLVCLKDKSGPESPSLGAGVAELKNKPTKLGYEGETSKGAELSSIYMKIEEGPTEPAPLAQTTPSTDFIKENINVLKTLIKEHDQQAKAKATPKKLAYDESEEEDSDNLGTKGLPIQVRELAYQGCTLGGASRRDHPELAKKLNDKIPKTVDEIFERVRAFIRGEAAARSAIIARALQWDKGNTRAKQDPKIRIGILTTMAQSVPAVKKGSEEKAVLENSKGTWGHVPLTQEETR
ncbi:hypothetical protein Tco_0886982 [Tanacetum coccineum]